MNYIYKVLIICMDYILKIVYYIYELYIKCTVVYIIYTNYIYKIVYYMYELYIKGSIYIIYINYI